MEDIIQIIMTIGIITIALLTNTKKRPKETLEEDEHLPEGWPTELFGEPEPPKREPMEPMEPMEPAVQREQPQRSQEVITELPQREVPRSPMVEWSTPRPKAQGGGQAMPREIPIAELLKQLSQTQARSSAPAKGAKEQPQRFTHISTTQRTKPATTTHKSPSKGDLSPEKHPLTADFDARKAVIWSEILKPKFEE